MAKSRTSSKQKKWPVKSYKNLDFLTRPEGRIIRILSEFVEPDARFRKNQVLNTICFFGSARTLSRDEARRNLKKIEVLLEKEKNPGQNLQRRHARAVQDLVMSRYYEDAVALAEKLTKWSLGIKEKKKRFLICSGGASGIMEAANRGARKAGGRSIGLNISLPMEQAPNSFQTRDLTFEFHYFFVRKFWFSYLAKALVAFPGGFGTMDELFELLTLVQTRKTRKYMPCVIYGTDYWNQIIDFRALVKAGTINREDLRLFRFFDDVDSAFEYLKDELTKHYLEGTALSDLPF